MSTATKIRPSTWFGAGYVCDAVNHLISFNTNDAASNKTLTELTDAEGHVDDGNVNNILFAILEKAHAAYLARVAATDTPTSIAVYKNVSTNTQTGVVTTTYTVQLLGTGSFTPTES